MCHVSFLLSVGSSPASPFARGGRPGGSRGRSRWRRLADDLDAHAAGGALDLPHRGSTSLALRSAILIAGDLADLVAGDPADSLALGVAEPFSMPAALRSRSAAGGVLRMKVNERSSKIVIWAGMTWPALSAVRSL